MSGAGCQLYQDTRPCWPAMEALGDTLLAFAPDIRSPVTSIQPSALHGSSTTAEPTLRQQPRTLKQPTEQQTEGGDGFRQQEPSDAQLQPRDAQHLCSATPEGPVLTTEALSQTQSQFQPHSQSSSESQPELESDVGTAEQVPHCQQAVEALPRECVALILSKCSPRDVGRAACVCRAWEGAAESEEVWERWEELRDVYQENFPDLKEAQHGKAVFEALRRGVFSASNGTTFKEYMLSVEPKTGTLSLHVSAFRCLYFYQRNDTTHDLDRLRITPYSLWPTSAAGSTFANSAALAAGLFHIRGELCPDFSLRPGTYSISFKLAKPPALHREALFPAVCMVSLSGESDALVDVRIDLHKDGVPSKCQFPPGKGLPQAVEPPEADETTGEPEFWAKSPSLEREQDSAWETINSMFLSAYSYFDAEAAWRMQLTGERVKPWKKSKQPLQWEEFCIGELELKDQGNGCAPLAIDIVLTDLECYTFQGPIWLDSVVITQLNK